MKTIVTNISEGIAYYPELADWVRTLDKDPNDPMFDALSLMEGDPDIIRCNGRKMYFFDRVIGDTQYVLTSDDPDEKEKDMLSRFHGEERDEYFESVESCWDVFHSLPDAIAYRGGGGYFYGINKYLN